MSHSLLARIFELNDKNEKSKIYEAPTKINTDLDIIIGAGFGRTGTSSLQAGLNALGYKTYHMREVMKQDDAQIWTYLYQEKLKLKKEKNITSFKHWNLIKLDIDKYGSYFQQLFDKNGYNASVDWPSCMFYLELIEYYERKGMNYKILLSVRDSAAQWWKSYSNTIGKSPELLNTWFWRLIPSMSVHRQLATHIFTLPFGENKRMDKQYVMEQYILWIESVKEYVHKDKLLIYNVKQGWIPLVTFLKLEIPEKYKDKPNEFIRTNDSKEAKAKFDTMEKISMCVNVMVGIVVSTVVVYFSGIWG